MKNHIKTYLLPVAMLLGILFYQEIEYLVFLSPYLIFMMLLVPYCRLSIKDIRIKPQHLMLLSIQVVVALGVYFALLPFNKIVAEGAFICMFCPTATSSPVITSMLGGSIASVISYSMLSNLTVALLSPFLFSFIGAHTELPFGESVWLISRQIFPLILAPMILAFIMRKAFPALHKFFYESQSLSFYLWALALIIVLGRSMGYIVSNGEEKAAYESILAIAALAVCVFQFYIGKKIGARYGDKIAGGQALRQKHTVV